MHSQEGPVLPIHSLSSRSSGRANPSRVSTLQPALSKLWILSLSLLLLCAAFFVPYIGLAQSADEIREQIAEHNRQIAELDAEIAQYEKQLQEIGSQKHTLQNTVQSIDVSRKQMQAKINVTKNNINTLELEITELSRTIDQTQDAFEESHAALAKAVVELNEQDQNTMIETVLSSDSFSDAWENIETIQTLQDALRLHMNDLMRAKQELTEDKQSSEEKHTDLVGAERTLGQQKQSLDISRREQASLLAETESKEANYQQLLEEKRASSEALQQTLDELESKLEYTLDPSRVPPAGKGILHWPLADVHVTQLFGKTSDSQRLYVSGTHNGVDLRASIGTRVMAALSGTVIGTGNTDGGGCYSYGKWILIKHGNGLTTLYGHLSEIDVRVNQTVDTGEVIGYSGFTGYATGPHLHFTVFASDGVEVKDIGKWYRENGIPATTACARKGAIIPVAAQSAYLDPMVYL